jgi:hypothetical protein
MIDNELFINFLLNLKYLYFCPVEKSLKYELQNLLSGNESIGARSLIQTIAHYLRKSQNSSAEVENSKFIKEQEKQALIPFINQNNFHH